jgi:hypothetical protein
MKLVMILLACGACAHPAAPPTAPAPPIAAPVAPAALPTAAPPPGHPALDDAAVRERSHEFYAALDRFDDIAPMVAPGFVAIADQRFEDDKRLAARATFERERHTPARTRTWSDEHVFAGPGSIVFFGHAIQHWPADPSHGDVDRDGWATLVWVFDGGAWKVALATWERGGIDAEKARWNETFRIASIFKKEPNQLLIDSVKAHKPGEALDVAMGQGRNALYLASQGWRVTGIDISDEGIGLAKQEAAKRKLKLATIEADVDTWDPGKDRWDLVTLLYAGANAKRVEHLKPSIRTGGLFVVEYFHADSDMAVAGAGGWQTGALAKLFGDGQWEIMRDDVVEDISDWGMTKRKLVRFVARRK